MKQKAAELQKRINIDVKIKLKHKRELRNARNRNLIGQKIDQNGIKPF